MRLHFASNAARFTLAVFALLALAGACGTATQAPDRRSQGTAGTSPSTSTAGSPSQAGATTTSAGASGMSTAPGGASSSSAGAGGSAPGGSGGSSASTAGSGGSVGGATGSAGAVACGYKNQGHVMNVTADISLCIPPQECLPETCPPTLGTCVNDQCVFNAGYNGLQTLPEAWATHYCDLQSGACQGVHQFDTVLQSAQMVSTKSGSPLCKGAAAGTKCVGIVASPPMMVGNREKFGAIWGLGMSEASGLCYEVTGPGGSALLALTDRCGGYCKCPSAGGTTFNECGLCKEAPDLTPLCECRGDNNCATQQCDWCAANNHPHFDLDDDAFNHVCGDQALKGSCQLTKAKFVPCMNARADWPPPL